MIFAVFGDINGNLGACQAVLDTLGDIGIHALFQTGNFVLGSNKGEQILQHLLEHQVVFVQGNQERLLVRYERKQQSLSKRLDAQTLEALTKAAESMHSQSLEQLRSLSHIRKTTLENISIITCHGSPSSQRHTLTHETPLPRLQRERELTDANIFLLGGAEEGFHRFVAGTLFFAPGPCVQGDGTARYTLVNTETIPYTLEQCAVSFNR